MELRDIKNGVTAEDCLGALYCFNADSAIVEDEETAEEVANAINESSYIEDLLEDADEYDYNIILKRLDLSDNNNPKHIYYCHNYNQSGLYVCFAEDWDY